MGLGGSAKCPTQLIDWDSNLIYFILPFSLLIISVFYLLFFNILLYLQPNFKHNRACKLGTTPDSTFLFLIGLVSTLVSLSLSWAISVLHLLANYSFIGSITVKDVPRPILITIMIMSNDDQILQIFCRLGFEWLENHKLKSSPAWL